MRCRASGSFIWNRGERYVRAVSAENRWYASSAGRSDHHDPKRWTGTGDGNGRSGYGDRNKWTGFRATDRVRTAYTGWFPDIAEWDVCDREAGKQVYRGSDRGKEQYRLVQQCLWEQGTGFRYYYCKQWSGTVDPDWEESHCRSVFCLCDLCQWHIGGSLYQKIRRKYGNYRTQCSGGWDW